MTTCAPRSVSQLIVGSAARMRKSSVILPSSIGTLKSVRTSTRFPLTSPRSARVGMRPIAYFFDFGSLPAANIVVSMRRLL